ncbi:tRNA (guanosine(37)-N1)-methyltransferase TrmD [Candidatus Uabimicrobium amorphum]|uniref:tRNA (guanine-N(1)-)-methyltransferase n=1 Tax=Uabimicrobium amorphum TaxID=2596890 RepID=A0A5S9IL46_UABAM|nr:tRNA (guanosine(37)-N1)-methyltransferase TrmD [Candidatus Uabimicrobium amorphum]BBM83541.1 tRNA (guanine-N(1)-)-methyltransferase [Candidatus Uabimicrobium amorphum]
MRIDILTLFPMMFYNVINSSMMNIAQQKDIVDIRVTNIRNFTYDKHHKVDEKPYGGGPGMLMKPEPIFRAVESIWHPPDIKPLLILLSPQGEVFDQHLAKKLSEERHLIMICGHYEGVDERVRQGLSPKEISVGDYVLTGGELPAMIITDAVTRLLPGALGGKDSTHLESFQSNLLEYPQYTKPEVWRDMKVPDILKSGHHKKICEWQHQQAKLRTQKRRPDLLKQNKKVEHDESS